MGPKLFGERLGPAGGRRGRGGRGRGRPPRGPDVVASEGPPCLVALLAHSDGYLAQQARRAPGQWAAVEAFIARCFDEAGERAGAARLGEMAAGEARLVGFALAISWEPLPSTDAAIVGDRVHIVAEGLRAGRARWGSTVGFFRFRIVDAVALKSPCLADLADLPNLQTWRFRDALLRQIGNALLEGTRWSGEPVEGDARGLLQGLAAPEEASRMQLVGWVEEPRVATLMSLGIWTDGVFSFVKRDHRLVSLLEDQPPWPVRRRWLEQVPTAPAAQRQPVEERPRTMAPAIAGRARRRPYAPGFMLAALRVARGVRSQREVRDVVADAAGLVNFDVEDSNPVDREALPEETTVRRGRVILDAAAMLSQRAINAERKGIRYLGFDKSPQWVEVLCAREEFLGDALDPTSREQRMLPIVALGHGHASTIHVTAALMHAVALEAGFEGRAVRRWLGQVRAVVTDHHAVESAIGRAPDLVDDFLAGPESVMEGHSDYLFPLAIEVLGSMHLCDLVLRQVVGRIRWWPEWQGSAKAVCAFLRNRAYRERLLHAAADRLSVEDANALSGFRATFAKWRWGTLALVLRDLSRVRGPLIVAYDYQLFKRGRDPEHLAVDKAIKDEDFWLKCNLLHEIVGRLEDLRGWLRGCPCHPGGAGGHAAEGSEGCPFKGRRAPTLRAELSKRVREWSAAADTVSVEGATQDFLGDLRTTLSTMAGHLKHRFGFADSLPWLVWAFRTDREAVGRALQLFDDNEARGLGNHRVSRRFLTRGSAWRQALEIYAAQPEASLPADLLVALAEYDQVNLDETAVEGVHKDITRQRQLAASSKLAWQAASARMRQNLTLHSRFKQEGRAAEFERYYGRWKALLQRVPWKARLGIPRRVKAKAARHEIYRTGRFSFEKWSFAGVFAQSDGAGGGDKLSEIVALKVEYLRAVVVPGYVFTVDRVNEKTGRRAATRSPSSPTGA